MKENMLKAELRKSVPSIATMLRRLENKDLLPAIFFIFSRKGCDNAAEILCENLKQSAEKRVSDRRPVLNSKSKKGGKIMKGKGRGRGRRHSNNNEWDLNEDELAMVQDEDGRNFRADLLDQILADEFDSSMGEDSAVGVGDDEFLSDANIEYYADVASSPLRRQKKWPRECSHSTQRTLRSASRIASSSSFYAELVHITRAFCRRTKPSSRLFSGCN